MSDVVIIPTRVGDRAVLQVEARPLELHDRQNRRPIEKPVSGREMHPGPERTITDYGIPSLKSALQGVEALATDISMMLDRVSPDKATVEFDVEIAVSPGQLTALLVRGGGKGTFKISLTWEKDSSAEDN